MKRFSTCAAIAAAFVLSGCASGYQTFYQPVAPPAVTSTYFDPPSAAPVVRVSTGDAMRDQNIMYADGYAAIGYSSFNGPAQNINGAIEQAKKVGAAYVVASRQYTNTISGAIPLTTPTAQTSYSTGTVNAYGSGGYATGNYSGTTTTYGTQTTYIPYSIARFDQQAVYFAPLKRAGFGVLTRALTDDEARSIGTAKGIFVRAVRRQSPAYNADVLPGDIIKSVNGQTTDDVRATKDYFHRGATNHITLLRSGKIIEKDVLIPEIW